MNNDKQGRMIQSDAVNKQLNQLEAQNAADEKYKKRSTNEVQPMATDDGITQ
ncbi:hypothetical protein [Bacillus sp. T33-2]|uniref:hypothetical protein n=1 Tax=Bacillus sp. T33-2 TaxID=2054168 RepID=UPI0015E15182|nr:hypothetical protein [Bacillus sp. T33-2]